MTKPCQKDLLSYKWCKDRTLRNSEGDMASIFLKLNRRASRTVRNGSLLRACKELHSVHSKSGIVSGSPLQISEDVDVNQSSGFHDQPQGPKLLPHGGVSNEDHPFP